MKDSENLRSIHIQKRITNLKLFFNNTVVEKDIIFFKTFKTPQGGYYYHIIFRGNIKKGWEPSHGYAVAWLIVRELHPESCFKVLELVSQDTSVLLLIQW